MHRPRPRQLFFPLVAAVAVGSTSCVPRLSWTLPVVVRDVAGPVAGAEVAIEGRFVGVTDAQGRLMATFEASPGHRARLEARVPGIASAHLPQAVALDLPSAWAWVLGADFQGASTLPAQSLVLETWDPRVTADEREGAPGESPDLAGALSESDLPAEGASGSPSTPAGSADASVGSAAGPSPHSAASQGGLAGAPETGPTTASALAEGAGASPGLSASHVSSAQGVLGAKELDEAVPVPAPADVGGPASDNDSQGRAHTDPGAATRVGGAKDEGATRGARAPGASPQDTTPPLDPSLVLDAFSDGRPLARTQVYSIRSASGRVVKLGETDSQGRLEARHPSALLGESLLVRHPCCVSLLRPLTIDATGKGTRRLRVDLSPGVSHDFVAVQTSYGHPRVVEKVALQREGRTLDVTGPAGVAIVREKNLASGLVALDVGSVDTAPPRRAHAVEIGTGTRGDPHLLDVARVRPRLPQVGFLELAGGDVVHAETNLRGEPLYRRARRDFLSRFVQEKALRPLIFQEVKKLADAVGVPLERWVRRGWDLTAASGEVDFLVILEAKGASAARARLVDAAGTVLWDETFPYESSGTAGEAVPELAGKAAFEGILRALPFEFVAKAVQRLERGGRDLGTPEGTRLGSTKETRVEMEFGADAVTRGVVKAGDVFQRVGKGEPCVGRLDAQGTALVVEEGCAEGVEVGDTFQRNTRESLAARKPASATPAGTPSRP